MDFLERERQEIRERLRLRSPPEAMREDITLHWQREMFISYGGGIHPTAIIGDPPEGREWTPESPIFPPVIDPTARVEGYVTIDAGYERPTRVGARSWCMKHVHVGHDAVIGEDVEIAPGAVICGLCEVGNGVHIGVNASILPMRKVGAGARIGAGAVVTHDVPAGETWIGSPARKLEKSERLIPIAWEQNA